MARTARSRSSARAAGAGSIVSVHPDPGTSFAAHAFGRLAELRAKLLDEAGPECLEAPDPYAEGLNGLVLSSALVPKRDNRPAANDRWLWPNRHYVRLHRAELALPFPGQSLVADGGEDRTGEIFETLALVVFRDRSALIGRSRHLQPGRYVDMRLGKPRRVAVGYLPTIFRLRGTAPLLPGDPETMIPSTKRTIALAGAFGDDVHGHLQLGDSGSVIWGNWIAGAETDGQLRYGTTSMPREQRVIGGRLHAEILAIDAEEWPRAPRITTALAEDAAGLRTRHPDWPAGAPWRTWSDYAPIRARLERVGRMALHARGLTGVRLQLALEAGLPGGTAARIEVAAIGTGKDAEIVADLAARADALFFSGAWTRDRFLGEYQSWRGRGDSRAIGRFRLEADGASTGALITDGEISSHQALIEMRALRADPCPI